MNLQYQISSNTALNPFLPTFAMKIFPCKFLNDHKTDTQASHAMEGVKMDAQAELQEHVTHWLEPANAMMLIQEITVMVNTLNL